MSCPFLEYRTEAENASFDHERPYCTAAEEFVQPMRADICNGRYGLAHDRDCEIYRDHEPEPESASNSAATDGGRPDATVGETK